MRARNIKPGFFKNEILGTADPLLSILYAGLWCLADREGKLENRPLRIKAEILPYRDNTDIIGLLTELSRLGFIRQYEVDGNGYIFIPEFPKHQRPHHTEKQSILPDIPGGCELTVKTPLSHGENPPDLLIPDLLIPDCLMSDSLIPDSIEGGATVTEEVDGLKDLHRRVCGLNSLPPLKLFREILRQGKPIREIEQVYEMHGGDRQPYRQRNIVEELQAIRDGTRKTKASMMQEIYTVSLDG